LLTGAAPKSFPIRCKPVNIAQKTTDTNLGEDKRGELQMGTFLKTVVLGYIAGAIAMLTAHELVSLWLYDAQLTTRAPWSMEISTLTGYPQIATDTVLGGLWGILFALILGAVPRGSMTIRGALLGLIGPAFLGALVVVPMIRNEPLFLGQDINLIWPVLLTGAVFGSVTAWLYGFLSSGCRLP
jgi:hypothetical protein